MKRAVAVLAFLGVLIPLAATPVAAHPLGNFTVNRAVSVVIGADAVSVRYIVDMAEIPTFTEIAGIDRDADGTVSRAEGAAWAGAACREVRDGLRGVLDGQPLPLRDAAVPELTFPAGAGGLETLRLVCHLASEPLTAMGSGDLEITDTALDERPGWRELTIAAGQGIEITASDVPASSASAELTSYPAASLQSPPDIRSGRATFVHAGAAPVAPAAPSSPAERESADDPLAGLLGPDVAPGLALLVAIGLGMAHAASPGHGKTLVAAYLVGSRGTVPQAAVLGLTVAATHTLGVFLLGIVVLAAGEWLVPDRLIGWLSLVSGMVVVALGVGLLLRVRRERGRHEHAQAHPHEHAPHHGHEHGRRSRELVALGFAGGLVPSASALIVLLGAITTERLVYGASLIVAFGVGMALVLAGLAAATTLVRGRLAASAGTRVGRLASRIGPAVPIISACAVLVAGAAVVLRSLPGLG